MNNNITFSSLAYHYFLDVCGKLQVKFFQKNFFQCSTDIFWKIYIRTAVNIINFKQFNL